MRRAILFHIESLREHGESVPETALHGNHRRRGRGRRVTTWVSSGSGSATSRSRIGGTARRTVPVAMMAHAMGTSHRIWDPQVPAPRGPLPPAPLRLARPRRHRRPARAVHPSRSSSRTRSGLMDALGLDRVHWVGISTGGMIGQGLGIHHPERVASLTLCNTTSWATPRYRDWVKERQAVVREGGMEPVWEMTRRLWFTDAFVDTEGPGYRAVRDVFVRTPVEGYLGGHVGGRRPRLAADSSPDPGADADPRGGRRFRDPGRARRGDPGPDRWFGAVRNRGLAPLLERGGPGRVQRPPPRRPRHLRVDVNAPPAIGRAGARTPPGTSGAGLEGAGGEPAASGRFDGRGRRVPPSPGAEGGRA